MSSMTLNTPKEITEQVFTITAADGYTLSATRYEAIHPIANIIVAGATGVPQAFYRKFAKFAAQRGYSTVTFDYRGIGRSKPRSLKGFDASFLDWAQLDLAAVVDAVASQSSQTFMVGHSFAGHAFGLLPNHHKIAKFYTFATGAGWHGHMPRLEAIRVKTMWNVVLPALTYWKGYTPMSMLGMGEDLPFGVYAQWKHWCQFRHYFFDDPAMVRLKEQFAAVRTPIIAANAIDDLWATPQSRDAFFKAYRNAPVTQIDIPLSQSLPAIGHMGYFRADAVPLWDDVLHCFGQSLESSSDLPQLEQTQNQRTA